MIQAYSEAERQKVRSTNNSYSVKQPRSKIQKVYRKFTALHLPVIYKRSPLNLVTTITVSLIPGLILGVFFSGVVIRLAQSLFNLNLSIAVVYPIMILGTVAWFVGTPIKTWFWEFQLNEENQIYLKKLTGRVVVLSRNDIKNVLWQRNKIIFAGTDESLTLYFNNLPVSLKFATIIVLSHWLPAELLPSEIREPIEEMKRLFSEPSSPPRAEPIKAKVALRYVFAEPLVKQILFVLGIFIISCLFLAFFFSESNLVWLLASLLPIVIATLFLWSTASTSIELGSDGIAYKRRLGSKFFRWEDIQIIVILPRVKAMHIWINDWYAGISLLGLKADDFALVHEVLLRHLHVQKILFGYFEIRS